MIWAVRLVRTGVERAFAVQLRLWLRRSAANRGLAATAGTVTAMMLQSSTAVAVLVSNFAAKGTVNTAVGLAILLGADLGSAIVTQLLLVRQTLMIPALLLLGTVLFLKAGDRKLRQTGRIFIGLALIFVALDMLRAATEHIVDNPAALNILNYLQSDLLSAFLIGAIFAWMVHSSVAAVLLFVTEVAQGALPPEAAMAMVLGANLGGAMIAYVLTLAAPAEARRIIVANLVLRGGGAGLVLVALIFAPQFFEWLGAAGPTRVINLHLAFNAALCVLALPFVDLISKAAAGVVKPVNTDESDMAFTALDPAALTHPSRALSCAARETLRMGERVEAMLTSVNTIYNQWDNSVVDVIRTNSKTVTQIQNNIKLYLSKLNQQALDAETVKGAMDLSLLATNLAAASDLVGHRMVDLAHRLEHEQLSFSPDGQREIADFHDRVLANVQLALNVMMTQNPDEARELVAEKDSIRLVEQRLQRKHLERLQHGQSESIETSNIHQETLRALKQVNTSFALVGYPILLETGDLLQTRLSATPEGGTK
ncbi:Na/Pi cotransporter family protein [Pelagimonas varians]|uniref:Na/Pi cotransporter family protein n=1 Tax=Pelagimonas varians TaxID=696760 RepID=UPI0027B8867B|nr:Na/Pi cotransporter family protein [Pelagimonas varians]